MSSRMEWSQGKTIELIKEFEKHECLWNANLAEHKDLPKRKDAWRDISKNLDTTVAEIEKKMRSLLATYRRERRKYFSSKKSENGIDYVYKPKWFGYTYMKFLHCINKSRRMRESLNPTKDHCNEVDPLADDYEDSERKYWDRNNSSINSNINSSINSSINNKSSGACKETEKWVEPKRCRPTDQMDVAYETMQTLKERLEIQKDEYSLYGEVIAHKLRKLSTEYERNVVQFKINQILFQAAMGAYKQTDTVISLQPNSTETTFAPSREFCVPSEPAQSFTLEENSDLRKYIVTTSN